MTNKACTPDNAVGQLLSGMDTIGVESTEKGLAKLDKSGQSVYHNTRSQAGSEALGKGNKKLSAKVDKQLDEETVPIIEHSKFSIRGGLTNGLKPTDFLPEEVTTPVLDYIDEFFVNNHQNLGPAKGEFIRGIKGITENINLESVPVELRGEVKHWIKDLKRGYPLYREDSGNILTKGINNVTANAIDFSGTILMGNPFETMVKLPTVYGFSGAGKGLIKTLELTKGNIWGKIPELESRGYYGFKRPPEKGIRRLGQIYGHLADGVMAITDRPLKNMAYASGLAKTGETKGGVEAIEKIAFVNRMGNDSRLTRSAGSRSLLTFMNYTLNTYNLLGSYMVGLTNPKTAVNSARALATYTMITGLIGGNAALIPEPASFAFKKFDPDFADWEAENITPVGKLVRPGSLTSLGITTQMANRTWQRFASSTGKAFEKLGEEDYAGAAADVADAGLSLSSYFRQPLGNPRMQKLLRSTRDLWEGEIDQDEYYEKLTQAAFPFMTPVD